MKSLFVVLACLTVLSTFGVVHARAADTTDCKNIDPNAGIKNVPCDASKGACPAVVQPKTAGKTDISQ